MKRLLAALILLCPVCMACNTLSIQPTYTESWYSKNQSEKNYGTVVLRAVTVDRPGGWDSIHSEIQGLAPLVLWKHGLYAVSGAADADYAADIIVHEREYLSQWRTRRSLAMEVRIWAVHTSADETDSDDLNLFEDILPLAVGRVITAGDRSLSSSHTINLLLSLAVKNAVSGLEPLNRPEQNQTHEEQKLVSS
jgi:hypothetical protein